MEADYKNFYNSYLKEYHEVRAIYLKNLLSSVDQINSVIKKNEINAQDINISLTNNTKFIIQADLRQNYFHSIETFFEFFFAFLPKNGKIPDNRNIIRHLVKSNWNQNYKRIKHIAEGKMKLNILDQKIDFLEYNVSVGHYLFYIGTFSKEKFDDKYQDSIKKSIEAIKKVIKTLAIDFSNRDEYNAYKHTMRAFPAFSSVHLLDADSLDEKIKFDLSNSVSYQTYNDKENETTVKTKLFDPERDFKMAKICSQLIFNMIKLRSIVFGSQKEERKKEKVPIIIFNQEGIDYSIKHNVEIQDLSFSSKKLN